MYLVSKHEEIIGHRGDAGIILPGCNFEQKEAFRLHVDGQILEINRPGVPNG